MLQSRPHRTSGSAMAEMPGAMFIFFIGLLMPLIGLVTLSYRGIVLYSASRHACYQASIEQSYTEAKAKAKQVLIKDTEQIKGVQLDADEPRVSIVVTTLADGAEQVFTAPLAPGSVNTVLNSYFIRTSLSANIDPLVTFPPGAFWSGIPGLTGPIRITNWTYQVFAENPNGLES